MVKINEYKKQDGTTSYMFKTSLGTDPNTGKRKYVTRQGFRSVKEAKLAYNRMMVDVSENGFEEKKTGTFGEIYELWYDSAYKNTVKESTLNKTTQLFNNHILPAFGDMKLEAISVTYCQKMVNQWSKDLTKFKELKNYVSRILDYAITLGILKDNQMKKITVPKRKVDLEDTFENFYNKDELKVFLNHVKEDLSFRWFAFYRLLAYSGFRKGEALALEWKDIDFKNNKISVSKTLALGLDNQIIVQTPKTKTSIRTIAMDQETMAILRQWKKQQAVDMLKFGFNTNKKTQPVFTTLENNYIQLATTTNRINSIVNRHNLKKITCHGLRHTHASLLFEAGASIKEVQTRLGHGLVATTMDIYTHVTEAKREETADKFAEYMSL